MEAVHYRGEAPMWQDLAGGSIDAGIGSYAAALPVLQPGRPRRRGVAPPHQGSSRRRYIPRTGRNLTRAQPLTFQGCVAPAKTPPEVVAKLSALFVGAGKSDRVRELLKSQGIDEGPMTLEASQALYKEEAPVWAELAASLGPQPQ